MDHEKIAAILKSRLGLAVQSMDEMKNNDLMIVVDKKHLISAAGTLKNDPALGFSTLMNHLGVDYGDRMAVIYNLYSPTLGQKVTVKVYLEQDNPEVPSLERAFQGISWYERETYDLFGILFTGHGNLKRLLLPEDWKGHPLRKDYVYPAAYNNIETARIDMMNEMGEAKGPHV